LREVSVAENAINRSTGKQVAPYIWHDEEVDRYIGKIYFRGVFKTQAEAEAWAKSILGSTSKL
jgi:hypothetical protein